MKLYQVMIKKSLIKVPRSRASGCWTYINSLPTGQAGSAPSYAKATKGHAEIENCTYASFSISLALRR